MDGQHIIPAQHLLYERPAVRVLGSVGELTLMQDKKWGATDGFTFQGVPIANASS